MVVLGRQPRTGQAASDRVVTGREVPFGINANAGLVVVVAADFLIATVPADRPGLRLGLLAAVLAAFGLATADVAAAAMVAAVSFLLFDGFLVNRLGTLSWHGEADAGRLLVLVAVATAAALLGTARRQRARSRRLAPLELWANHR